ncbi:hypothetical protein [Lysobacter sp. F6437]|uniref:hypothetical protein n=1 Tax=Lysobacter sp. F6437 TaxID=3459296 RepID=UPI00403DF5DC
MTISRNAIAPILGLALASALVACSPSDTDSAAGDPGVADTVAESSQPENEAATEAAETTAAPVDLPTGPLMDQLRSMVNMSAGLLALGEACAPGSTDDTAVREAVGKLPMRQHLGLSDAQVDALFEAEYAKNKQKLDAMSDAEVAASCKEIEDATAAAAARMQGK